MALSCGSRGALCAEWEACARRLRAALLLSLPNPLLSPTTTMHAAIFDWSMKYQDGSRPTDYASAAEMTEEKRQW